jgi:hypothetical protein
VSTIDGVSFLFSSPSLTFFPEEVSVSVDGGLNGGSSVRRPGSDDNHLTKFETSILALQLVCQSSHYLTKNNN